MGEIYDHVFETRGDVVTYFDDDDHRDAYIAQKTREEEAKYERRKESYYSCLKAAKEEQQRLAKLASEESLTGLTTDNSTPGLEVTSCNLFSDIPPQFKRLINILLFFVLQPSNAGETSTLQPCSNHSTDLEEKIHLPK